MKDHADVTKESSEDSASKVTEMMVMVMIMCMCRTGSTRKTTMCGLLETATISMVTGEVGTLANVTLCTRRLDTMVTRGGTAP